MLAEVAADAAEDGGGDLLLAQRAAELALLGGIGEVVGFDQHRGNVGGFEDYEGGLLHFGLAHGQGAIHGDEDLLGGGHAVADGGGLGEVEEHGGQGARLVVELDAAFQVGIVLALGQPAGGFARGAARGEDVYRGAGELVIADGVGVDGNEEVRLGTARDDHALAQGNEDVAAACQDGPHAALLIDSLRQQTGDCERDVLLFGAAAADGAGVLAAMSGIDRHDDVTAGIDGCVQRTNRCWNGVGNRGAGRCRITEGQDELGAPHPRIRPVGVHAAGGTQHEHQPQRAVRVGGHANAGDESTRCGKREARPRAGPRQVDDGAKRVIESEEFLARDPGDIESETGPDG